MKKMIVAALLVAIAVSTAYAYEVVNKDRLSSQTDYQIKCNNGQKWRLTERHSDGWFAAPEGNNSYMYKSLDQAAKAVCNE